MSEALLSLSSNASVAELHGEAVLLDLASGRYFSVNRSGAVLLRLLRSGAPRAALPAALVTAFGIDAEAARKDVDDWIERLSSRGLLVSTPPGPS